MAQPDTFDAALPAETGYFELWDPNRNVNRIVRVFRARDGRLAVKNPAGCCRKAFYLEMWALPCFEGTHWKGPISVPDALPAPDRASSRR